MSFKKGNNPWSKGKKIVPQKVEVIFCACKCGEKLNRYDSRNRVRKYMPNHHRSFILGNPDYQPSHKGYKHTEKSKKIISLHRKGKTVGENNPNWKGGWKMHNEGYKLIRVGVNSYKLEHRVVMENHLKRALTLEEVVHHLNGIKTDNRIENLALCRDNSEHKIKYHSQKIC